MLTTVLFAFLSGVVTVASPCVLPVLPFLLSGTLGGRSRPYGIITGFIASFTAFTLFLSTLIGALGISSDVLRWVSVALLVGFGLTLIVPAFHTAFERISSQSVTRVSGVRGEGFWGGILVGATLGVLWSPCVGPIMASVITLALNNAVTTQAFVVTFAFSLGTAIPMFAVMMGGRGLLNRIPWLMSNLSMVQRAFGFVLIAFALGIAFNLDRQFQTWVLDSFPNYTDFLTKLESAAPENGVLNQPQ